MEANYSILLARATIFIGWSSSVRLVPGAGSPSESWRCAMVGVEAVRSSLDELPVRVAPRGKTKRATRE